MLVMGKRGENFWFCWARKFTSFIRKSQGAQARISPGVPLNESFPPVYGRDDAFSSRLKSYIPYLVLIYFSSIIAMAQRRRAGSPCLRDEFITEILEN